MSGYPIYIFDAYGTLFDLSAATRKVLAEHPSTARLLSEIWRARQLEYAWTDMALGFPTNLWDATTRALDTALQMVGFDGDVPLRDDLLAAYAELDAYDDALPTLERISTKGGRSLIFSNANPEMLRKCVAAAKLDKALDEAVSVDNVGFYKPNPKAYAYIQAHLGIDLADAYFVSSNPWDAAGAANARFKSIWVNRLQQPYSFPAMPPYREVGSLSEL